MMFYLLKRVPAKRRGLLSRLFSSGVHVSFDQVCSLRYYTVTVDAEREIDWRKVTQAVGSGSAIILPVGLNMPDFVPLKRYDTDEISVKLLTDAALKVAALAASLGARISVMLIDKRAEYVHLLEPLLSAADTVTAVTDEQSAYNEAAAALFEGCGASPMITDNIQSVERCDIIIAPCGISGCGTLPLPSMIFAPSGNDCISVRDSCIDRGDLNCFDQYSILDILAAMQTESGFVGRYPQINAVCVRGEDVPLGHLAQQLKIRRSL